MQPFKYQKYSLNEIFLKFKTVNRLCLQLSTGGGKTVIFTTLSKYYIENFNYRVLILCHRVELIEQSIATFNKIGVSCEKVTAKTKALTHQAQCYVAMVETSNNRLKSNPDFFKDIDLVIVDECHVLVFDKLFSYFPKSKILGCTATPIVMKKITFYKCKFCKNVYDIPTVCCDHEADEWKRPFTMSEIYEDIVIGPNIDELIKLGKLVKEISFIEKYVNLKNLKTDSEGEFTADSLDGEYAKDDALFNVLLNYQNICKGKKTIIFNSSTNVNLLLYDKFKAEGLNVRFFDSKNVMEHSRAEIIDWFKNERDAILLNVGVFTTGFDVSDVEAIILNRATASLGLFIQMVGRGARITELIYKDSFILVDGGGNVDRHLEWSDPNRDWRRLFFHGATKPKIKKDDCFDVETCFNCGTIYPKSEDCCPACGYRFIPSVKVKILSQNILSPIRQIPRPNGDKIYNYTLSQKEDVNFAFKILISQIVDMFIFYKVSKIKYLKTEANGKLDLKIKELIRMPYFILIKKNDIAATNNRTINYLLTKIKNNLDKFYGL